MTREEALTQLRNGPGINEDVSEEYNEAVDMAIKALEQEPCEDAISRQAALDLAKDLIVPLKDGATYEHRCIDPQCVRELPPVQPKSRWIPVSEKLPEKGGDYLVTTEWKGSYSGDVYIETNMAVYREKEKEWDCAGVVAWMPLPEPYEADMRGEE